MTSALGFDGMMHGAGQFFGKGGSSFGASKLVGSLAPLLAVTQLASDIMDDNDIERLKRYEAGPRSRLDQLKELDAKESAAGIYGDPEFAAYVKGQNAAARGRLESELGGFGYNPDVTQGRWDTKGSPGWSIDDIRKATGIGSAEPAKAVVEGNATLETKVTVSPIAAIGSRRFGRPPTRVCRSISIRQGKGRPG
jgi:hypothetical protein